MPTKYKGTLEQTRALNAYIKLQRAAESVITRTTSHLSDYSLTLSQFAILEALYHLGTLSQRELADKLLKSTGNMSIVLKNIEKRGLVSRKRDPQDNRYVQVCITEHGAALIESMLDQHVDGIVEDMGVLSAAEQETLSRLCRKLGLREGANGNSSAKGQRT
jgi:MarR family 2-MHQ and catechol resistance regulon transcriptional repressor